MKIGSRSVASWETFANNRSGDESAGVRASANVPG